jgi:hypothetical protein
MFVLDKQMPSSDIVKLRALNSKAARCSPEFIHVMDSTIKGGGLGVFTSMSLPADSVIGEYIGRFYPPDINRPWDSYMMQVDDDDGNGLFCISSRQYNIEPYSWTRFINTTMYDESPDENVEFTQVGERMFITTRDDIIASPQNIVELFCFYGMHTADFL